MADTDLAQAGPTAGPTAGQAAAPGPAAEPGPAPGQARPAGAAGPGDRSAAAGGRRQTVRGIGVGLLLLATVVLGFAAYLYGLSGVQEARSQAIMSTQFRGELASQLAPVGPTRAGNPVAIIDIPSIGVNGAVVVQGTTPQNLMVGPGHLPDTPLPGQTGVAVIYGRRAAFGGPFSHLAQLRPGATITTITGQGTSTYTVAAVADSRQIIKDPVPNRLLLLTASSPVIPSYYIEVDARLASTPRPGAGVVRTIYPSELPMANDPASLSLTMVWALALALVAAAGTVAALRWSFWPAYLATVPLALAVLWNLYQSLAALLPNMY